MDRPTVGVYELDERSLQEGRAAVDYALDKFVWAQKPVYGRMIMESCKRSKYRRILLNSLKSTNSQETHDANYI